MATRSLQILQASHISQTPYSYSRLMVPRSALMEIYRCIWCVMLISSLAVMRVLR